MNHTITIPEQTHQALSDQLEMFVTLAKARDPKFVAPSLEEFAQAKLSGDASWLGLATIDSLLQSSPYRDAGRVMREDFAAFLKNFILSSRLYGFAFVHEAGKSGLELRERAGEWLNHLSQVEPLSDEFREALVAMIEGASMSIDDADAIFGAKVWKVADTLSTRFDILHSALPKLPTEDGPAKLAQFITVGEIACEMGIIHPATLEAAIYHLRAVRPDFFPESEVQPSWFNRTLSRVIANMPWRRVDLDATS